MKNTNLTNLHLLAAFFTGIIATHTFYYLVYKNPKVVTAPGLTSLIAFCTLTLGLITANTWLKSKIKDSAYKNTEMAQDYLGKVTIEMFQLRYYSTRLSLINPKNLKEIDRIYPEIKKSYEEFRNTFSKLAVYIDQLPAFEHTFLKKHILKKVTDRILKLNVMNDLTTLLAIIDQKSDPITDTELYDLKFRAANVVKVLNSTIYIMEGLLKLPYDKKYKRLSNIKIK